LRGKVEDKRNYNPREEKKWLRINAMGKGVWLRSRRGHKSAAPREPDCIKTHIIGQQKGLRKAERGFWEKPLQNFVGKEESIMFRRASL